MSPELVGAKQIVPCNSIWSDFTLRLDFSVLLEITLDIFKVLFIFSRLGAKSDQSSQDLLERALEGVRESLENLTISDNQLTSIPGVLRTYKFPRLRFIDISRNPVKGKRTKK